MALFTVNNLELRIEARKGNTDAVRVLSFRKNGKFLLVTILWGVVAANVLLALLANSVLRGLLAFLFSTFVITGGDILGRLLRGIVRNPVVDDLMTGNKMVAYSERNEEKSSGTDWHFPEAENENVDRRRTR